MKYKIEWDESKNQQNIEKHSLDFNDFHLMFNQDFITTIDNRKDYGEIRYIGYSIIESIFVVSAFTIRDNHSFRVISFRKGNHRERKNYEQIKNQLG